MGLFKKRLYVKHEVHNLKKETWAKMSGKGGREATYHGTNQSGNDYTRYNDGGYRYHNYDSQGNSHGHYYETGSGSKFYNSVGRSAEQGGNYRYYENKAGERSYQSTSKK